MEVVNVTEELVKSVVAWCPSWLYCDEIVQEIHIIGHYLDIHFLSWLFWLMTPVFVAFILPLFILVFLYASVLFLQIYKHRQQLRDAYAKDFWEGARKTLAAVWDAQATIWHGYEIDGLEKLPDTGAALLVYYHGAIPVDYYYLLSRIILQKHRSVVAIGDRFLFRIPGWKLLMEVFWVVPGTKETCVQYLKNGELLAVAPGGVREAQFSDENYTLLWGKRCGFCKVAIEANVPIFPVFTRNVLEAFRTVQIGRSWLRTLYEKTRLPLVPIYGMFPVKLKTYIGDPISWSPSISPEKLAVETRTALEQMIRRNQRLPGNIFHALLDRLWYR